MITSPLSLHSRVRLLSCLVLLCCISGSAGAQSFSKMRDYLHLRDALAERKNRIQTELTRTPDVGPLDAKLDTKKVQQELLQVEDWLKQLADNEEGLTEYYRDRITRLISEIRYLLPALEKREASLASLATINPPPPPPPPVTPPPVNSATTPVSPPPASIAVVASEPAPSVVPANAPPPPPTLSEAERRKQRKAFFASMGVRHFRTFTRKPSVVPVPTPEPVTLPASATAQVSPVTAPATAAAPLLVPDVPNPVSAAGTELTSLSPGEGPDPQTRQQKAMRPLAIMIENHNKARPQTALDEAEVVFEIPVEGGITRFMALFYHVAGIIGPIRSCRDYFVDRALEVNALYVHCGGSPQGYEYIQKIKALAIDEISSGEPFFRDSIRKAPHNLYSRMQDLIDHVGKKFPMELPYQKLPFLYADQPSVGELPCRGLSIKYHGNYTVVYRFNARHNRYDRYMNGTQHLDRITAKPVSPGTVIVQVAYMKTIDDKGRQDISFIGKGRAYILFGGVILPANWEKAAPREFTRWVDDKGRTIRFDHKKPIWVQVVAPKTPLGFDPPLPQGLTLAAAPVAPLVPIPTAPAAVPTVIATSVAPATAPLPVLPPSSASGSVPADTLAPATASAAAGTPTNP